ncbi:MAG: DUF4912 domain-containing protein [Methylococcaceae bacterium]|nr:DUF4912 domain-containing protein [Methylococcaceae bacterium]
MTFWQSRYNPQLKLSQQDLLDVSEKITQAYAPQDSHVQSELVLMPVDPVTLYAYWNLEISNNSDRQFIMRVYSNPEISEQPNSLKLSFDIQISSFKGQQKIYLPIAATAYSAVIGEINADNRFSILVASGVVHVPRETPVSIGSLNDKTVLAVPFIKSETPVEKANTKANNSHTPGLQKSPEYKTNNKHGTVQSIPMFDHLFVAENNRAPDIIHVQQENSKIEYSNAVENLYPFDINTQDSQYEPFILKNFNNQGYDLKVYANSSVSEFVNILSMQESGFYISPKKSKATKQNSSGLGLYL